MALAPGVRLGPYEVLAAIGKGGMGEVYRATDTKLKRDVAVKVLPASLASDPERLARFQREAEVLASLNHPNIAQIHGLEDAGGTKALVMELVEGPTLADRIAQGAIPVDEALPIAKQIAEALEAAHEQGIIHRDLKPANVKLRPDGVVKVLDFGLAKALEPSSAMSPGMSQAPTITTPAMTQAGMILGTAAYMSPEQAHGKTVDKRTDIWALGCLLYELLTGKQTFPGEDVTDILGAILHKEPDWSVLPAEAPPGIRTLLRRCLQKDRSRRFHSAADIRIEIEEAETGSAETVWAAASATPTRPLWRRAAPFVLAGLAVAVVAAGIAIWNRPSPAVQPVSRLVIPLVGNERLVEESAVAFSPDGTHVAYAVLSGQRQATTRGGIAVVARLYVRSMDSSETKLIAESGAGDHAFNPFFSPDGQWIGFFAEGKLNKISVSGGAPLILGDAPNHHGGSWGPDDTIVVAPATNDGLWSVPAAGGTPQMVTALEADEVSHRWPQVLPDGRGILFTAVPTSATGVSDYNVAVQGIDNGDTRVLVRGGSFGRYAPTGHLVYYQAGTVMAVPFDLERLEVTGNPAPVVESVRTFLDSGLAQFSFSGNGSLIYAEGRSDGGVGQESTLVWVDRQGLTEPLPAPPGVYGNHRLSPDGRKVGIVVARADGTDVWVYDITRDTLTRLTFDGSSLFPRWTPDGSRVFFEQYSGGPGNLFWKPADGSGPEEPVVPGEQLNRGEISPDGRVLVYLRVDPTTKRDLWSVPLEGEREPQPFLQTPFNETGAHFSPDGRWLVYLSDQSGVAEVYVRPFPGPGGEVQVSTDGATGITGWLDGELFYRAGADAEKMMVVETQTEPTLSVGRPRLLFEGYYDRTVGSVTPDGQRFLLLKPEEQQSTGLAQIQVVLNWTEELKRLVPVD